MPTIAADNLIREMCNAVRSGTTLGVQIQSIEKKRVPFFGEIPDSRRNGRIAEVTSLLRRNE